MTFCQRLINRVRELNQRLGKRGVALFIVLTAMATLAIFVGEITYTAQINQKLAYDRLDQVKATALAKSGLRLALLRIRAYKELQKMVADAAKAAGATAAQANAIVPKEMLEKIWNEPVTVPFTGDISNLPTTVKDAVEKFRKDSNMEGKLYVSVLSQSTKFNLNSYLTSFMQTKPSPSPSPAGGNNPGGIAGGGNATPTPTGTPVVFDQTAARDALTQQLKQTFQNKFDDDQEFRERYRNLNVADLADDIMAWNDLTYDSNRMQSAREPYKRAPFYDVSELHYLPTVDDEIYELLAPQYSATVESIINVNKILEPTLMALAPEMTKEERKKFFEDRDQTAKVGADGATPTPDPNGSGANAGGPFKAPDEFFQYLQKNSAAYNTNTKIQDLKDGLTKRGFSLVVDESQFLVHIEATVHQTKKTLEAVVAVLPAATPAPAGGINGQPPAPPSNGLPTGPKRSSLKVIQMRYL